MKSPRQQGARTQGAPPMISEAAVAQSLVHLQQILKQMPAPPSSTAGVGPRKEVLSRAHEGAVRRPRVRPKASAREPLKLPAHPRAEVWEYPSRATVELPHGSGIAPQPDDDPDCISLETAEALRHLLELPIPTLEDDPLAGWNRPHV